MITRRSVEASAMRKSGLLLLMVGIAFPAFAAKRVTVEQLEQVLAAAHGKPDADIARQLRIWS